MVDLGDALGVLLIGSLFVVVFWRGGEVASGRGIPATGVE
jgi:hypothetical protein